MYAAELSPPQRSVLAAFTLPQVKRRATFIAAADLLAELVAAGYVKRCADGSLYPADGTGKALSGARARDRLHELVLLMAQNGEHLPAANEPRAACLSAATVRRLEAPPAAAPAPMFTPAPGWIIGAATEILTPQRPLGEPAHYAVVELEALVASHTDAFQPDPRYPPGVQEREYHRQREEQWKVVSGARRFKPALVLCDTPSPVDGPPIVTSGSRALVLGGNGRSMMIRRAFADPTVRESYRTALLRKAEYLGLDRDAIEGMRLPVLVRALDGVTGEAHASDLAAAVRRFNEGLTQQLSPRARAIAEAGVMSLETVLRIGHILSNAGDVSLREVLRARPAGILEALRLDGIVTPQNQSAWLAGGNLTDEGKDRVEGMFLGRVIGTADRMAATAPALLERLGRAAPELIRVSALNPELDEIPTVQAAVDVLNEARRRGLLLGELLAQSSLFGSAEAAPEIAAMARLLEAKGPRALRDRFAEWARAAAVDPRQATMFRAPPSRAAARAMLLNPEEAAVAA